MIMYSFDRKTKGKREEERKKGERERDWKRIINNHFIKISIRSLFKSEIIYIIHMLSSFIYYFKIHHSLIILKRSQLLNSLFKLYPISLEICH